MKLICSKALSSFGNVDVLSLLAKIMEPGGVRSVVLVRAQLAHVPHELAARVVGPLEREARRHILNLDPLLWSVHSYRARKQKFGRTKSKEKLNIFCICKLVQSFLESKETLRMKTSCF